MPKIQKQKDQPLKQLIADSRVSEQKNEKKKENCDIDEINCSPERWWL